LAHFHPTEDHFHHLAERHTRELNAHDKTRSTLDAIKEKVANVSERTIGTVEIGGATWLGGMIEGRLGNPAIGPIPANLLAGLAMIGVAHLPFVGGAGTHLNNVGTGFVASYLGSAGYAFGKRWKDTGKFVGGGGHPWRDPYGSAQIQGGYTNQEMGDIVAKMAAAAAAVPHP